MMIQMDAEWIGKKAKDALIEEALTTPKPGLVDAFSNGAHDDMCLEMFIRSAEALEPYFAEMARLGLQHDKEPKQLFLLIRQVGLDAEQAMYRATGGVNTHKGAIFTMGILSAAAGACLAQDGHVTIDNWIRVEQEMVREILIKELEELSMPDSSEITHGIQNMLLYGSGGVRREAALGYPSIQKLALPVLKAGRKEKREWNLVKLQTLFTLMSQVEDGNILARTGTSGLNEVWQIAAEFLNSGGAYQSDARNRLERMDQEFTAKNYSNGGCADLLAAAIFMDAVDNTKKP